MEKSIEVFSLIRGNTSYQNITSSLSNFVNVSFEKISHEITNMSQIAGEVQEYTNEVAQSFIKIYSLSSSLTKKTMSFDQYEVIVESFESLISKALYGKVMTLLGTDTKFDRLIRKYSFLTEEALGLPLKFDPFELQKQLRLFKENLIEKKTPKGKLTSIRNMSNYLSFHLNDESLLWKAMLFAILNITIPNIKSLIRYCALFRNKVLRTTEEDKMLINVNKAFELLEQLSLNNINELKISPDEFKEFAMEFEKTDLLSTITMSNGHFAMNSLIDDRLLELINFKTEGNTWNSLYGNTQDVKEKAKESLALDDIQLNKATIQNLLKLYYHINAKETKMSELKHIKSLFKTLIYLIQKDKAI